MGKNPLFDTFAKHTADKAGRPFTFLAAFSAIIIWAIMGPMFQYSDTWQLVINTSTSVITFLMVFLIQNTQNRDTKAIQVKLDELLRATQGAHVAMIDLEELNEKELRDIHDKYIALAKEAHERLKKGGNDCDIPELPADQL